MDTLKVSISYEVSTEEYAELFAEDGVEEVLKELEKNTLELYDKLFKPGFLSNIMVKYEYKPKEPKEQEVKDLGYGYSPDSGNMFAGGVIWDTREE